MTPLPMILNRSIERRLMAFFVGCACVAACAQPQAPSPPEPVRPRGEQGAMVPQRERERAPEKAAQQREQGLRRQGPASAQALDARA